MTFSFFCVIRTISVQSDSNPCPEKIAVLLDRAKRSQVDLSGANGL